jgi:hypothetical protein
MSFEGDKICLIGYLENQTKIKHVISFTVT